MLPFFPYPYPEETFYSLLARYNMYSGNLKIKHTIEDLYGDTSKRSTPEFTSSIEILLKRIPGIGVSPEEIIYNHTLFPFYSAFIPKDKVKKMEKSMIIEKRSGVSNSIGINASSITNYRYLKHCRLCIEEDVHQYGETYWHRVHQLPGVLVCPKHKISLLKMEKQLSEYNQHEFLVASSEQFDFLREPNYSEDIFEQLFGFSQAAQWLLNNKINIEDYNYYRNKYISALKERNITSFNGRVNQGKWLNLVLNYYNKEFLTLMESNVSVQENVWLKSIVRKHRSAFHPVRHILVMLLLYGSLSDFYNDNHDNHEDRPFGKGPWPCLNSAHHHYRKKVITNINIKVCSKTKRVVGIFNCSCGFKYSRRGPDKEESNIYIRGRILEFGQVWRRELITLSKKNLSMRKIGLKLGVDSKTVIGQLLRIKVEDKNNQKTNNHTIRIKEYRQTWSNLIKNNPTLSKTQLRKLYNNTYMWLYRNDKEWLNDNSPKKNYILSSLKQIDHI